MGRYFLAIDVPIDVKPRIAALQQGLAHGARKTDPSQAHITLKFIGEIEDLEAVRSVLAQISHPRCRVNLEGTGGVPQSSHPKVLFVRGHSDCLVRLAGKIENALQGMGEPFKGVHVTVARFKTPVTVDEVDFPRISFTATDFVLYESRLTSQGPVYSEVQRFLLGDGDGQ